MTHSETVILSLLYKRDYYGYELEKKIEDTKIRYWTDIGFSSIYSVLNKLAKEELIEFHYQKEYGAPRRKVFSILSKGKTEVENEIKRILSEPEDERDEFYIGLIWSDFLSTQEQIRALREYIDRQKKKLTFIEALFPENKRKRVVTLALERSEVLIKAEIVWLEKVINEINDEKVL